MHRAITVLLGALALAATAPAIAQAALSFQGNWEQTVQGTQPPVPWEAFEYGGQFDGTPAVGDQLEIVTSPVREGSKAAKFTVHPGDAYGGSSGERALARWVGSDESEGDDYYYGWSTLFPTDWTGASGWQLITEWHADSRFPIAPVRFNATTNALEVAMTSGQCPGPYDCEVDRGTTILRDLSKGKWNDFIVHVQWRKAATGLVEVWHRVEGQSSFVPIARIANVPTLPWRQGEDDTDIYLLHGLYRNDSSLTQSIYHDGFVRGDSYQDVLATFPDPPASAAPPASAPAPPPAPPAAPPAAPAGSRDATRHASRSVTFSSRPALVAKKAVRVRAQTTTPGVLVAVVAYNVRGKVIGAGVARSNAKGKVEKVVALDVRPRRRVVVELAVATDRGIDRATWSVRPPGQR